MKMSTTPWVEHMPLSSNSIELSAKHVMYSPDEERVLVAGGDSMFLFDTDSGELLQEMLGDFERIQSIAFTPDGKRILAGQHNGTLSIWNPDSGERLRTVRMHPEEVRQILFTPKEDEFLTCGLDGVAKLWRTSSILGLAVK